MQRKISRISEPFADSRETVAQTVAQACARLTPDALNGYPPPDVETVRGALESVTTSRVSAEIRARVVPRNRWRFRRTPRKRDDISRVMLQRLQWHCGTGSANIGASVFAAFDVGAETFETLDTIATVYVYLFTARGLKYSNSERWRAALGDGGGARLFILGHSDASGGGTV